MNPRHLILPLFLLSLLDASAEKSSASPSQAEKAKPARPGKTAVEKKAASPQDNNIHIIAEFIEIEHEAFSDWLLDHRLTADASELRKEVQDWVKRDDADIFETIVVHARSGQRAKIESIEEVIYPTAYDPAQIPTEVSAEEGFENLMTPPNGTGFETRNAGITLEVDPVLSENGGYIDLNLAPEIVRLVDIIEWEARAGEAEGALPMPLFHTAKSTTQVTVKNGSYALLGTLRLPEPVDEDREDPLVLLFVRADAG